ncbi:hypothetical protein Tco_0957417 [Tanacetum coccineum]
MMVQQVLNPAVEILLVIMEEQLVLDTIVDGQLVGDMIVDEPLVLHMIVVVEKVNRIIEQLVKAVFDIVIDCYSMEESCLVDASEVGVVGTSTVPY